MQQQSFIDKLITVLDNGAKTVLTPAVASRPSPAEALPEGELSAAQKAEVVRLMRVNHCGEICAQALYTGQSLFTRDDTIAEHLKEAAAEEIDHLAWTALRLRELGGKQSYLNPLWYGGAFTIGAVAGLVSDKVSLGFVAETEKQVSKHLKSHLDKLPDADRKSRAVVEQMNIDEQQHAANAVELGGVELPDPAKKLMRCFGKVMTKISYHL